MNNLSRRAILLGFSSTLLLPARQAAAAGNRLGIIFVGQSTCPYCRTIAPFLKQLADTGSADVMLASMDRRPVPPLHEFADGLTHPLTRHFQSVPQILIYNPKFDQITHVVSPARNIRRYILRLHQALRQSAAM